MVHIRPSLFTPARFPAAIVCIVVLYGSFAYAQRPTSGGRGGQLGPTSASTVSLSVNVRDATGVPMEGATIVTLVASVGSYYETATTRDASVATFDGLPPGDYDIEATYPGYKPAKELVTVTAVGSSMQVYLYMIPESA